MLKIGKYIDLSLIDWDGRCSSVIFTVGCNFRCRYCYNADLVLDRNIQYIPVSDVLRKLDSYKFRDAVVITGGEPTIHKDLPELCMKVRNLGYDVKLDTNGSNPDMIQHLLDNSLVDYVAVDIKAPLLEVKYAEVTNALRNPVDNILETIEILRSRKVKYEFRTTVIPSLSIDDLVNIGEVTYPDVWYIQQYYPVDTLDPTYSKDACDIRDVYAELKKYCSHVRLRN